jgi:K+-sensing histidine kinase KdpD
MLCIVDYFLYIKSIDLKFMSRASFVTYCVLVIIILVLSALVVFRNSQVADYASEERALKDSILTLSVKIDSSHARQQRLERQLDGLSTIESQVITKTHDKINFIYSVATPDELDSIIRSNWKTKSRYN